MTGTFDSGEQISFVGVPGPDDTGEGLCEPDTSLWPTPQFTHLSGE